jgi:hypothetical protein
MQIPASIGKLADSEVACLCRLPGYAAWAVSVQVGGMLWWLRSA